MMGSTSDPADGKAVAGSVFAAVVVYAVCYTLLDLRSERGRYFGRVDHESKLTGLV